MDASARRNRPPPGAALFMLKRAVPARPEDAGAQYEHEERNDRDQCDQHDCDADGDGDRGPVQNECGQTDGGEADQYGQPGEQYRFPGGAVCGGNRIADMFMPRHFLLEAAKEQNAIIGSDPEHDGDHEDLREGRHGKPAESTKKATMDWDIK